MGCEWSVLTPAGDALYCSVCGKHPHICYVIAQPLGDGFMFVDRRGYWDFADSLAVVFDFGRWYYSKVGARCAATKYRRRGQVTQGVLSHV
jgi:hypothetical protein